MATRSRSRTVTQSHDESRNVTPAAHAAPTTQPATVSSTADHAMLVTSALASASTSMEMWGFAKTTSGELIDHLHAQTEQLKKGDMTQVEEMLYCQAVTLQAVFAKTLQHAMSSPSHKHQSAMLALAFKAQAQCRATLETLVNVKNPRAVAFVKQANIANGPQQINNGAGEFSESSARPCAREKRQCRLNRTNY